MTWDGLREWTDPRSVTRGKEYVGRGETPTVFADGNIVSEVHGSDDYYTKLSVDADGDLRGECTCPVGWFRVLTYDGKEISFSQIKTRVEKMIAAIEAEYRD